jgi:HEAT repeat protein
VAAAVFAVLLAVWRLTATPASPTPLDRQLEGAAVWALEIALHDPDVRMRRNATLALRFLAEGYFVDPPRRLDIREALPLRDTDRSVRAWAAQAIGAIGPAAAPAVPALSTLLSDPDEGPRTNGCWSFRGIGPAAREALPALRRALADPSANVRHAALLAIEKVQ